MNKTTTNQIKSRKRVAEHGEVFTAEREVNAMLDLVKPETVGQLAKKIIDYNFRFLADFDRKEWD